MTADELIVRQPARKTTPVPVDVREIVECYLKAHGFDGLAGDECGCQIGDLAPCYDRDNVLNCQPGYVHTCDTCPSGVRTGEDPDDTEDPCPVDDHPQDGGWCISTEKPEVAQ